MKLTIEDKKKSVSIRNDIIDDDSTWSDVMYHLVRPMLDGMGYSFTDEKFAESALNGFVREDD